VNNEGKETNMQILAIETTGPNCSTALLHGDNDITELVSDEKLNHLQVLTPMIREVLARCGTRLEDLDYIAASEGPGSFTGIRIGVSTARALSQASGVPLIAVPTLMAFGCGECEGERIVCPLFDARRHQVYAGAYRNCEEIVPGGTYMLDEFLALLTDWDDFLFLGDGLRPGGERIRAWAAEHGKRIETRAQVQTAASVAELAQEMLADPAAFGDRTGLDYGSLHPNYMRIPEAERKRREKLQRQREQQTRQNAQDAQDVQTRQNAQDVQDRQNECGHRSERNRGGEHSGRDERDVRIGGVNRK
jgi:tRNA threonylcarbamoyladenosine biosynthesis protein TsaB